MNTAEIRDNPAKALELIERYRTALEMIENHGNVWSQAVAFEALKEVTDDI